MCVYRSLSTSRIDKGDGPGFFSDVATASLGLLFIKIQNDIDSLVLTGISHARRACTMRSIARIYARVHVAGFKLIIIISFGFLYRLFNFSKSFPIIQIFICE